VGGQTAPRLLEGIRVLDFTRYVAGPYLTRCLAVLGAEVIKVERPDRGDEGREHPHQVKGQSGMFLQLNTDKKGLCLDLKHPKGLAIAKELAARCDVVVENFRPGVMEQLGLGYPVLREVNPRVILCSVSSFGQTGPYRERAGFGIIADALSGALDISGFPDRPPPIIRMPIADTITGVHGVGAICAALFARERHGRGQWIDLALLDCMVALHENALQAFLLSQGTARATRCGHHLASSVIYGVFEARDGCLVIAAHADVGWARLAKAMGRPELAADERYTTMMGRIQHREELVALVRHWVRGFASVREVLECLEAHQVPCAPVHSVADVVRDPQVLARKMLVELDHPIAGRTRLPNLPFRFSAADTHPRAPAPLLGQHNRELAQNLLGYSLAQILDLEREGVLHAEEAVRHGPAHSAAPGA
jgi:crotonobetainyl-CoA:carnitine CoA-transferase CaiB-like acyl-CoA transferase